MNSYRDLEVWKLPRDLAVEIHRMTVKELPKFELFEEGSQIRRSSKSVRSNIVEGFGRRRYKGDFIRFATYALASCDETIDHLEGLFDTGSLKNKGLFDELHQRCDVLGRKLNRFVRSLDIHHRT